ncbi:MAG: hypothetical protein IPH88_14125 [Bacteroidales bacterium]|nr:hypothetical protein [Bacteroidales bacterium]
MPCQNIYEVLEELDKIIESTVKENNYLGIFAYVYRRTTAEVLKGVENKSFDDNARMVRLDVTFANLYLQAYQDYRMNRMISQSWQTAFDAKNEELTILQHIMLGMNAHINLDLAIAASTVMEGADIHLLKEDFNRVNVVLAHIVDELQKKTGKVSRFLFLLDWAGKRNDEKFIDFSMAKAREQSWNSAVALWSLDVNARTEATYRLDTAVNLLATQVRLPSSGLLRRLLRFIGYFEEKSVSKIINAMKE